jgi:hypothetical protein
MTTRVTNEPVHPVSQANAPGAPNPFRYGWRFVRRTAEDGTESLDQVPLTLEDVLHPQENDVIPERPN